MLFRTKRTPLSPAITIGDLASTSLGRLTEVTLTLDGATFDAIEGGDATIALYHEDGRVALALRVPLSSRTNLVIEGTRAVLSVVVTDELDARRLHTWHATIRSGRTVLATGMGEVSRAWHPEQQVA